MNKISGEFEQSCSPLSEYQNAINEEDPMPLYAQVEAILRHLISVGRIPKDESFFTEEEIAQKLKVSRPTVRTALDSLVANGYIVKQRGKRARVIYQPPVELLYMRELLSYGEMLTRLERNHHTQLIERSIIQIPVSVGKAMKLPDSGQVVHIKRLRYVDQEPVIVVDSCLPATRFSKLMDVNEHVFATTDLYALLQELFGICILRAERAVSVGRINIRDADLLATSLWEPCLKLQGVAFDTDDTAVEYFDSKIRGDRVVLKSSLRTERKK